MPAVAVDLPDIRAADEWASDRSAPRRGWAVARALDLAAGDRVPERDVVRQRQPLLFLDRRRAFAASTAASTGQNRFCGCPQKTIASRDLTDGRNEPRIKIRLLPS